MGGFLDDCSTRSYGLWKSFRASRQRAGRIATCQLREQVRTWDFHRDPEVPMPPRGERSSLAMAGAREARRSEPFLGYPGSAAVIELLADKWTIPVIHSLAGGPK